MKWRHIKFIIMIMTMITNILIDYLLQAPVLCFLESNCAESGFNKYKTLDVLLGSERGKGVSCLFFDGA